MPATSTDGRHPVLLTRWSIYLHPRRNTYRKEGFTVIRVIKLLLVCIMALGCVAAAAQEGKYLNQDKKPTVQPIEEQQKLDSRYVKLFQDDSFIYSMDKKTAKWIICPNTNNEYIIDVWIRLDALENNSSKAIASSSIMATAYSSTQAVPYSYPARYYLEHYYIRPDKSQIQFLSELEVTGRPDNNIEERAYDVKNWENLVPDSIEESIYQAVTKQMKRKGALNLPAAHEVLEDVFRISI